MREQTRTRLIAYGVAALATGVTLVLRLGLVPVVGDHTPFMTFLPAVMLSAYLGGLGPGFLATLLGAACADYFLIRPLSPFGVADVHNVYALGLFLLTGVVISGLSESRLRSQRRIAASERRYAVTLASIGDAVIATDTWARVTFLNPVAEALTGWPLADAVGRPLAEVFRIVNEQTRQPAEDRAAKVLRLGTVVGLTNHTALLARDGREVPIDDCGAPIIDERGGIAGVVLVFRDVTRRRRAEEAEALRASEAQYRSLADLSPGVVWTAGPDGAVDYANPFWFRYTGLTPEQTWGWGWGAALHPDDLPRVADQWTRAIRDGEPIDVAYRVRRACDGAYRWFLAWGTPVRDREGRVVKWFGTCTDIDDQKQAEEALRQSEERFRTLAKATNDAVWDWDLGTNKVWWNEGVRTLFGYRLEDDEADPAWWLERVHPEEQEAVESFFFEVVRGTEPSWVAEYRFRCADGSYKDVYDRGYILRNADGQATRMIGAMLDISARKRAEEALRQAHHELEMKVEERTADLRRTTTEALAAQQRFQDLVNSIKGIVWEADATTFVFSFVSEQAERVLSYPAEQWLREPTFWKNHLHPEDCDRAVRLCQEATAEKRNHELEYRMIAADGGVVWLRDLVTVVIEEGRATHLRGVMFDITERKRADEALRRQANLLEQSHDAIFVWELPGKTVYWNRGAEQLYGFSRDEAVGRRSHELLRTEHPMALEAFEALLEREGSWSGELMQRTREDRRIVVESRHVLMREADGCRLVLETNRDITERKRAEEALRETEERYRVLTELSPQMVWMARADGYLTYCNQWWVHYSGLTPEQTQGDGWIQAIHPDHRDVIWAAWQHAAATGGEWNVEVPFRRAADGQYRWHLGKSVPLRDAEGRIVRWIGVGIDIHDRKRAEEALRESEAKLEEAQRIAHVGHWDRDLDTDLVTWSDEAYRIFGLCPRERSLTLGQVTDLIHPDDRPRMVEAVAEALRGGARYDVEYRVIRPNGEVRIVHSQGDVTRDRPGQPRRLFGTVQDITERRAKEAAEAANRAKDEFLANVSHEIRTPMNAILGMTELALATDLTEDQRQCLTTVKSAADNLLGIINDLLDFSKIEAGKMELAPADFSLRSAVGDTLRALAARAHKKGIELIHSVRPDVPDALIGDAGRLRQVLLNLVGNAIKFTDAGEVVVRVSVDEETRRQGEKEKESSVSLSPCLLVFCGERHRHRHPEGQAGAHLPGLRAGGRLDHPPLRRHRPGPDHRRPAGGTHGRANHGGQ